MALSSTEARAEPAGSAVQPVVVAYDAQSRCPSAQYFVDQIRSRFDRIREADRDEPSIRLVVSVRVVGDAASGRLEVHGLDGNMNAREMRARRCEDLVAALALVAALSIAREAKLELVAPTTPATMPVSDGSVPAEPATAMPSSTNVPPPTPAPDRGATIAGGSAQAPLPRSRISWSLGAGSSMLGHALPAITWGGRTWVQARVDRGGAWSPAGRLSLGAAAMFPTAVGAGEARFQLLTARVDLCPMALRWQVLAVEPCVSVEGGALFGQGVGIRVPRAASAPWLTAGPLGRLGATVGSRVTVEVESGLVVPLSRPFMTFEEALAYEVPVWGFVTGLGATMQFL